MGERRSCDPSSRLSSDGKRAGTPFPVSPPAFFTARAPPWPEGEDRSHPGRQLGMARLGQVHVVHSIQLTALPVQETRAQPGCQPGR